MTRTADGHVLRVTLPQARALAPRLESRGLAEAVRANYRGNVARAVGRTLVQLGQLARRAGSLVGKRTGRRYAVFQAADDGELYRLLGRPLPDGSFKVVDARSLGAVGEREDGDGARRANLELLRVIFGVAPDASYAAVQDAWNKAETHTRGGMRQINAKGEQLGANKPDRTYYTPDGRIINVEIDTDRKSGAKHLQKLRRKDRDADHWSLIVDQNTGQVLGARVLRRGSGRIERVDVKDGKMDSLGLPLARPDALDPKLRKENTQGDLRAWIARDDARIDRKEARRNARAATVRKARATAAARPSVPPPPRPAPKRGRTTAKGKKSREMEAELEAAAEALEQELAEALGEGGLAGLPN